MNLNKLCAGNSLETLDLFNMEFWIDAGEDYLVEFEKFLFPIPNKETGIHHFSSLKCLKMWGSILDCTDVNPDKWFKNKHRVKLAFPAICQLVLGDLRLDRGSGGGVHAGDYFGGNLLQLRAPYLESLHLGIVRPGNESDILPAFSSLSELCLSGLGALVWLEDMANKIEKGEVTEWNLDKINFDFGTIREVRKLQTQPISQIVGLVLNDSFDPKYIRIKYALHLNREEDDSRVEEVAKEILETLVEVLRRSAKKKKWQKKVKSLSLHLEVGRDESNEEEVDSSSSDGSYDDSDNEISLNRTGNTEDDEKESEKEEPKSIRIKETVNLVSLLSSMEEIANNVALHVSIGLTSRSCTTPRWPWLDLKGDYSQVYSVLRRKMAYDKSLLISSKNWPYCFAEDKWKCICKACEMSFRYGWEVVKEACNW